MWGEGVYARNRRGHYLKLFVFSKLTNTAFLKHLARQSYLGAITDYL